MDKMVKLRSSATLYADELGNVRYSSDYELVVGRITNEFRFIPNGSITQEQGLTSELLIAISGIIKTKAGIGEKRSVPVEEPEESTK